MSKILGTQEFIAAHKDHILTVSVISTVDTKSEATVGTYMDELYIAIGEMFDQSYIEDISFFLWCDTCKVEEEINSYEVDVE